MAKILLNVDVNSKAAQSSLSTLQQSIEKLVTDLNKLTPNKDLTAQLNALARAYGAINKAATEQAAVDAKLAKLEADVAKAEAQRAEAVSRVEIAATKAAAATKKEEEAASKAKTAYTNSQKALENLAKAHEQRLQSEEKTNQEAAKTLIQEEKLELQAAKTAAGIEKYGQSAEEAGEKTGFLGGSLADTIAKFAKAEVAFLAVRTPLNLIKNALSEVDDTLIKTENAVIELQRVLDETVPAGEISNRLYDIAYQYGSTFENASTIAANFARAGRTWNESLEATEAALLAMNVAELNATEASDGLLSILAQFGMETSELTNVVDKLNKTADKNPVSTQKLLQAIQRAGSAAKNANVSFDQTLGLITSISEATNRSGQNIGTAINSLIQYSTKNVDVFADLSEESAAIVDRFKSGLASIVDVWQQVAIDIHNDKEARDNIISALGTDGLEELSSTLHDELGDLVSEINGVYDVANTYRKNYFIALLDNMDRFMDVQEQLTDYQGYSQEENNKYMETYTAKVNQLNDAWQKLANDEQGILALKKTLVEIGIGLVDIIEHTGGIVNSLEMIASIAGGIAIVMNAEKLATGWAALSTTIKALPALLQGTASAALTTQAAFGWIGIAVTALGVLITSIKTFTSNQQKARDASIEFATANKDNAKKLDDLYVKYETLNPKSDEFREVESQILEILGDKAELLPEVTRETDDYRKAVEELTEAQLAQYKMEALAAKKAAEETLLSGADGFGADFTTKGKFYRDAAKDAGISSIGYALGISNNTVDSILNYYDKLIKKQDELALSYEKLLAAGDKAGADKVYKQWEENGKVIASVKDEVEAYRSAVETADEMIVSLTATTSEHIVGREGVVPNLQEVREKAVEAKDAAEDLADATESFGESAAGALSDVSDELGDLYLLTEDTQEAAKELTENIKDLTSQIDDAQNAIKVLTDAQAEYDEYGSLSIDTLQDLIKLGGEYLDLIIDEERQVRLNEDAVNGLISAKQDLIDQLIAQQVQEYAVNKLHEYMEQSTEEVGDEAVIAAQKIELAAMALAHFEGNEEGAKRAAEDFEEALHRLALHEGVLTADWEEDWVNDVKNFRSGLTSLYSRTDTSSTSWKGRSSTKSSSSTKTQKDEYLESLKAAVSLRESELSLIQYQGASQDEQIAKIRQIQGALSEEANYLRSIGASQEDINKLSVEWWKYQEKINKFAEDNAKAAEKAREEAEKAAEEQRKAAEKAAEEARKAAEEAIKAETAARKQDVADAKAKLTLMEKQGKSMAERVAKMKEIQNLLHVEAEWLRQIEATQAEIDALSAEWWDWQEKILKLYQETLDTARDLELEAVQNMIDSILKEVDLKEEELKLSEKQLAVTEAQANLEEAIVQARIDYVRTVLSEYITGLSNAKTLEEKQAAVIAAREKLATAEREAQAKAIIDSFNAEKDGKNDLLTLEERRLAVEKARQALTDAENEKTTRYYNEATGQWEYAADARNVQSAQENLKSAIEALNSYVEEQAWNEVADAVENGSVTEGEVRDILEKWAKESYGEGSPEFIQKITAAYRKAMGTAANPDTVAGQLSAVDSAVESLNDYLKQEAVKELEKYIADGNTDTAGMRAILNKWLSMGEGGELYEWRDGLLSTLGDAIRSGYYDDSKVQSAVNGVESAVDSLHDYIRSHFISEVADLVRNGTAEELRDFIDSQSRLYDDMDLPLGWANDLYNSKSKYESIENAYSLSDPQSVIAKMKANSAAWWDAYNAGDRAETERLSNLNLALGSLMGWSRGQDGAWYYPDGSRVYDEGGILSGLGGLKATRRKEMVLDPSLTEKILRPQSEAAFRAFTDAMNVMVERGERTASGAWSRAGGYSDSHNVSNVINGIPISSAMAETHTIAELCRLLPLVGRA